MLRLLQCITFLIVFIPAFSQSQSNSQYIYQRDYLTKFDHFTVDDGLSSRRILDIYQDRFGYIWIGTENGLNRFDGYEYIVYKHDKEDSASLSHNHITSITEDMHGNLWVGTKNGLNRFDRENETFEVYKHRDFDDEALSNNYIRKLYADTLGFLWIETVDGILNRFHVKNRSFKFYLHTRIHQPYYQYHDIYQDSEGYLWIGGRGLGPYRFDIQQEEFYFFQNNPNDPQKKRESDVAAYLEDSRGEFWVSGIDGIYRLDRDTEIFTKFFGTSTFDMVEDEKGNIWFATGNGVLRFNFQSKILTHFKADQNNVHSLGEDDVNCILLDYSGNLWFGTNNGISKYSPKKYKFQHIYHIPANEKTIISNNVSAVMQDDREQLWIGTFGYGLDRMNLETNEIIHYQRDKKDPSSLASNYISDLYQDKQGTIWIGHWRGVGFNKYNPSTDDFTLYSLDPNTLKSDWYNDFLEDSHGNFWAGFWGAAGMQAFDREKERFTGEIFSPLDDRPIDRRVSALRFDGKNKIWIGCKRLGTIYQFDYQEKVFRKVAFENSNKYCSSLGVKNILLLPDTSILIVRKDGLGFYEPNTGNVNCFGIPGDTAEIVEVVLGEENESAWVNTKQGFYRFRFESKEYEKVSTLDRFDIEAFLPGDNRLFFCTGGTLYSMNINTEELVELKSGFENYEATKLTFDSFSNLWIGTKKVLFRYNTKTDEIKKYLEGRTSKHSLTGEFVTEIYQDSEGLVWIGTIHGLNLYNPVDSSMLSFQTDENKPNTLVDNHILSVEEAQSGDIWIGTQGGLCLYQKSTEQFVSYNQPDNYSLTSRLTTVMIEDSGGDIWVGTSDKGLNRISEETGVIRHFRYKSYDTTSISDDEINCIFEDSRKRIWVGTNNGLNLLNARENGFIRYSEKIDLPDKHIMAILEDNEGYLWISTQNGLVRFHPEKDTRTTVFYKQDGLQSNRFSKASQKLTDGRLVFGGEGGFNIFNPSQIAKNNKIPELQITGFEKFDKPVGHDFTTNKPIRLNYHENFFTIHYSSMDFTAPRKNKYLYKLVGVDENWVSSSSNKATYTAIDPGEYIFKVKGTNNDHIWSNQPVTLQIILEPPFYRTTWFYLLVILTLILIVVIYLRLRIMGLEKEKYSVELEQKLLRSQMNPHFIFNSLTSIQNYVLENDSKNANHYLAKFSKLLRLILENSRNNFITLAQEVQTLEHYLLLQKIRYGEKFDYQISVPDEINRQQYILPPMLAQPFIENSIEHGFQNIDYKGILDISFTLESDYMKVRIEDNGVGIEKSKRLQDRRKGSYQSLATKITEERIQNINRFRRKKIKLRIQEITEINKQGTRVELFVPVKLNTGVL